MSHARTLALLALIASAAPAVAAPYSLAQKNFFALEEVAVMVRSELQTVYAPTSDALNFTGTYDAAGWGLSITGSFDGRPVSYAAIGIYDAPTQTTNYTSSGTVGSDTWVGGGFTSFFDVFTEISLEADFHIADTVTDTAGKKKKPDREDQTKKTWKTEGDKIIDMVEYYKTEDGVIVGGPFTETSSMSGKVVGDAVIHIDDAYFFGTFDNGLVTGVLIPEPSSGALALLALGGGLLRRRR